MNTTTPEEIKAAREEFGALTWPSAMGEDIYHVKGIELKHLKIIDFALRFTEKMMEGPSACMLVAGGVTPFDLGVDQGAIVAEHFKAMVDQALRELNHA